VEEGKGLAVSKLQVGLVAILLVCCIVAVLVFVSLNSGPVQDNVVPSRLDSIPAGAVKVAPGADVYPPVLHSDLWFEPVPLGSGVNTAGAEDSPFVTADDDTLYFFFTPNVSVPVERQVADGVTGIYVSRKVNGVWTAAERVVLQDHGKLALDGAEFVQDDVMWFASAREGYTGVNLFTAEYKDGKWSGWQYAGDGLNKDYQVGEMCLSPDGNELYFHSVRAGGLGGVDIWVTRKVGGQWQAPENVAAVNTAGDEGWPYVTQDAKELWFTRTHLGSPAIYRSVKVSGTWIQPELIISQFAGEPSVDSDGNIYFVHHFFSADSKMIEADIYFARRK